MQARVMVDGIQFWFDCFSKTSTFYSQIRFMPPVVRLKFSRGKVDLKALKNPGNASQGSRVH